jgi:hypothetical protein
VGDIGEWRVGLVREKKRWAVTENPDLSEMCDSHREMRLTKMCVNLTHATSQRCVSSLGT